MRRIILIIVCVLSLALNIFFFGEVMVGCIDYDRLRHYDALTKAIDVSKNVDLNSVCDDDNYMREIQSILFSHTPTIGDLDVFLIFEGHHLLDTTTVRNEFEEYIDFDSTVIFNKAVKSRFGNYVFLFQNDTLVDILDNAMMLKDTCYTNGRMRFVEDVSDQILIIE